MKILSCVIWRHKGDDAAPIRLAQAKNLQSFGVFQRNTIDQHIQFATRTVVQRTSPGTRQTVQLDDNPFVVHVHVRVDGLCGTVVADKEYPTRVAFSFLSKQMAEFERDIANWRNITIDQSMEPSAMQQDIVKFQNPHEADKITKIQSNLDEITEVMHKNINEVLKRGENLDLLMDKSNDLNFASKQFYKQAKKTNQCCSYY